MPLLIWRQMVVDQLPHIHICTIIYLIKGEAKVLLADKEIIIHENESFLVEGKIPHSVWNNAEVTTIMIGITVI
ncbi:MAG: cupin domain-containing protein [Paludibacteraceae bacterium]|nr:cupin domain-containing protein [Paludibacteraceae bacterium]